MKKLAQGFTLIELLIVIAILGALAALLLLNFQGAREKAVDTQRRSDLRQYQTALEAYANRRNAFPVRIAAVDIFASMCGSGGELTLAGFPCKDEPDAAASYKYISDSYGVAYVLWGYLKNAKTYFVICSNGNVGTRATEPTTISCPL